MSGLVFLLLISSLAHCLGECFTSVSSTFAQTNALRLLMSTRERACSGGAPPRRGCLPQTRSGSTEAQGSTHRWMFSAVGSTEAVCVCVRACFFFFFFLQWQRRVLEQTSGRRIQHLGDGETTLVGREENPPSEVLLIELQRLTIYSWWCFM